MDAAYLSVEQLVSTPTHVQLQANMQFVQTSTITKIRLYKYIENFISKN